MVTDIAYIALGSNVGDREQYLHDARARVRLIPGVRVIAATAVEETEPLGPPQGAYLNQMLAVQTMLSPPDLLEQLLQIEEVGGRTRDVRWGPRTIDLDIVAYEHATWHSDQLVVPHAELPNRDFWQRELAELRASSSENL